MPNPNSVRCPQRIFFGCINQTQVDKQRQKTVNARSAHLNISLHATVLQNLNLAGFPRPLGLEIDLELGGSHTEHLQDRGLPGVKRLALSADGIAFLALGQLEHDLTLHQTSGDAQFAQSRLNGMADGLILVGGDLTSAGSDQAVGESERAGSDSASTGKVRGAEVLEVLDDGVGGTRGEEETDSTGQVGRKTVQVLSGFIFGGGAEGDGHNLGLAEEQTGEAMLVGLS